MGAGLADPDGVLGFDIVLPNAEWPVFPPFLVNDVTDNRDGRCCAPTGVDDVFVDRLCGILDGVAPSSLKKLL